MRALRGGVEGLLTVPPQDRATAVWCLTLGHLVRKAELAFSSLPFLSCRDSAILRDHRFSMLSSPPSSFPCGARFQNYVICETWMNYLPLMVARQEVWFAVFVRRDVTGGGVS